MEMGKKVKIGLDEVRMLTLGVQVLVGFQFHGVFLPRFAELPAAGKVAQLGGLLLLLASLAALITPATQHLLVEGEKATWRIQCIITRALDFAFAPLSIALGLDIAIAVTAAFGAEAGVLCGAAVSAGALSLWFAWTLAARRVHGVKERSMAASKEDWETPLSTKIDQMLTEARTILPGAQALLGFQLTVVLTDAFPDLAYGLKLAHVIAMLLVAATVLLLMTPAAYHRIVYAGEESEQVLAIGTRTVTLATFPLALALALECHVVATKALESELMGASIASFVFVVLAGVWLAYPFVMRSRRAA